MNDARGCAVMQLFGSHLFRYSSATPSIAAKASCPAYSIILAPVDALQVISMHADRAPLPPSLAYPSALNSFTTVSTPRRLTRASPLNSIPTSKVQQASAFLASQHAASPAPISPQTATEWSNIVQSLAHQGTDASPSYKAGQLLLLASSLQRFPDSELEALTASPGSLAAFLNVIAASSPPQASSLYSQLATSFLHPLLQHAVASTTLLSSAADTAVAGATRACADSYWHPEAVAAAAQLQLVFCRGHRTFWNLLTCHPDCLHECDPHSLAHIAECAAALRIRHSALWTPLAASTNSLALHMSTSNLHACARALGATIPDPNTIQPSPGAPPATPSQAVRLDSLLEVVQWRDGRGGFDAAELPYTALSMATILSQTLPGAGEQPLLAEAGCVAEGAPRFWRDTVQQSRGVCREGYGGRDALTMALACVVAERYLEGLLSAKSGAAGSGASAEGGDEGSCSLADSRAAVSAHKHEMFRFAALAAVVEGGSAGGDEWGAGGSGEGLEPEYCVESMQVWVEVLVGCASAGVQLGADLLPGAARVVRAMHGEDAMNAGPAVAALAGCAAVTARRADDQRMRGIAATLRAALADAAAHETCMGPMHAIEVLQILAHDVPGAAGRGEEPDVVARWLLGEMKGQLGGLPERWLTRYLSAVAALPGAFAGREELREELRECLQSRTFSPQNSYDFSGVVNQEFFADVRHELAPEGEDFTPEWRSAHGRHAAGFTPSEAAEAARCVKALRLFNGGSNVLEALLAVSMGGAADAALATRPRGAAEGGLQGEFQQMVSDEVENLGGEMIDWMADEAWDDELVATSDTVVADITREYSGVYSVLADGGMGWMGQGGGDEGLFERQQGRGWYAFEGTFDGAAAQKVAEVMDQTQVGLAEVTDALESADWDADVAAEMLIRESERVDAAAAARGAD